MKNMWTTGRGFRIVGVLMTLALSIQAEARSADFQAALVGAGIRPVTPPSPAVDFDLPRLAGDRGSLSDYRGNWVVLTFWATWCKPCRVEMPSLQRLHQERAASGLAVVGISVDGDRALVGPFVDRLGLDFPILWDERGEASAAYRATSIPLSYLIDPDGRIVGLARGARDWSQLLGLFDSLLAAVPPDPDAQPVYASGPIDLPSTLKPPTAKVALSEAEPRVRSSFDLLVDLHWAGTFEEYLPHPPRLLLPEGMEQERVTASTSSRDGANVVSYRLTLRALEAGTYILDPVELRYTPRFESTPVTTRVSGPTVVVRPRTIAGMRPKTLLLGSGGLALAALAGLVMARSWRIASQRRMSSVGTEYERLCTRFEDARGRRLRGDVAGFVLELAEIDRELGSGAAGADPEWHQLTESARYGGQVPPTEELDRLQRSMERRLDTLRPDPEEAVRQEFRLPKEASEPSSRSEEET